MPKDPLPLVHGCNITSTLRPLPLMVSGSAIGSRLRLSLLDQGNTGPIKAFRDILEPQTIATQLRLKETWGIHERTMQCPSYLTAEPRTTT